MSQLTKQQLQVLNTTNFPNNTTGYITPALLREYNTDSIDSFALQSEVDGISASVVTLLDEANTFATTGSNTFNGNQQINGDVTVDVSSSFNISNIATFRNAEGNNITLIDTEDGLQIRNFNQGELQLDQNANADLTITNHLLDIHINTPSGAIFFNDVDFEQYSSSVDYRLNNAQGAQGIQGVQGSNGTQGTTGTSIQGATGQTGATGAQGGIGSQGFTGIQGNKGDTGDRGPQGAVGQTGIGTQGYTGAVGPDGAQGPQGTIGSQGPAAAQGQTGTQGAIGTQGSTGQSITGAQGGTGAQGSAGTNGNNGAQGSAGTQGVQGIQGVQGAVPNTGSFAKLSGGNTFTGKQIISNPANDALEITGSITFDNQIYSANPYSQVIAHRVSANEINSFTSFAQDLQISTYGTGSLSLSSNNPINIIGDLATTGSIFVSGALAFPSSSNGLSPQLYTKCWTGNCGDGIELVMEGGENGVFINSSFQIASGISMAGQDPVNGDPTPLQYPGVYANVDVTTDPTGFFAGFLQNGPTITGSLGFAISSYNGPDAVGGNETYNIYMPGIYGNNGDDVFIQGKKGSANVTIYKNTLFNSNVTIDSGKTLTVNGHQQYGVGQFQTNVSQSGSANVSQSINFEVTDMSYGGVTIQNNSRITMGHAGQYNIQFSAQCNNTDNATQSLYIWLKKNGSNVAESATKLQLPKDQAQVMTVLFNVEAAANDYYELAWQSTNAACYLLAENANGNIPAIPAVIVSVNQVR